MKRYSSVSDFMPASLAQIREIGFDWYSFGIGTLFDGWERRQQEGKVSRGKFNMKYEITRILRAKYH